MLDENEVKARLEREAIPNVDHYLVTVEPDHTGAEAAFIRVVMPDYIAALEHCGDVSYAFMNLDKCRTDPAFRLFLACLLFANAWRV